MEAPLGPRRRDGGRLIEFRRRLAGSRPAVNKHFKFLGRFDQGSMRESSRTISGFGHVGG
jgi:hypothetical protein